MLGGDTRKFILPADNEKEMRRLLTEIYDALKEKGHDPVNHIVGYILTEDPAFITNHKNARSKVRYIDRYELLAALVRSYLTE